MNVINQKAHTDNKGNVNISLATDLKNCDVELVVVVNAIKKTEEDYNDLKKFAGKLKWKGNPLDVQKKLRDEWK